MIVSRAELERMAKAACAKVTYPFVAWEDKTEVVRERWRRAMAAGLAEIGIEVTQ